MYRVLSTEDDVFDAQVTLQLRLQALLPQVRHHTFGHLGKAYDEYVRTNGYLWCFHGLAGDPEANRYWNPFGIFDPQAPENIVVGINFPLSGKDRSIAGAFARDETNKELEILHRGKVGGGKEGIGQSKFVEWFSTNHPERMVETDDVDGNARDLILVGAVRSAGFLNDLTSFVVAVAEFKRR